MMTSRVKAATISFGSPLIATDASMVVHDMDVRPTLFPMMCELVIEIQPWRAKIAFAPRTVQNIPYLLRRVRWHGHGLEATRCQERVDSFRGSCETGIRRE